MPALADKVLSIFSARVFLPNKQKKPLPSFMRRFSAQMLDSFLSTVVTVGLLLPPILFFSVTNVQIIVSVLGVTSHPLYEPYIGWLSMAYFLIIIIAWLKFQTTPGKSLLGLKIVDFKTKQFPSKTQFALRSFGYLLAALPFFLGYVWIIFDKNNRGLHDYMSGTQVVYMENKPLTYN